MLQIAEVTWKKMVHAYASFGQKTRELQHREQCVYLCFRMRTASGQRMVSQTALKDAPRKRKFAACS